jgi:O-antigen biosynthesis protein
VRVAFLLQDLQLSGGVGVTVEHASQLSRHHGFDCHLVLTRDPDRPPWPYRGLRDVPVISLDEARAQHFDVAVATWWETCLELFSLEADRYAYFIQLLEDSTYDVDAPERMAVAMTMALPVRFITEARWIAQTVEALQPGTRALYVRNGIPKDVFVAASSVRQANDGPLRIVIEGNRTLPHKGVDDAIAAVGHMRERHELTLVTGNLGTGDLGRVDRIVTGISHTEMAELLSEQHVMLKLTRAEGMYGPPLEGFHMGATVATTPVTGFDEYVRHRWNGLVVGWDDPHGTARSLDLLARDRGLLSFLRLNALETARAWPSWEQASQFMALALRTVHREPAPNPRLAGIRLTSDIGTDLSEHQRKHLRHVFQQAALESLWSQKAWQYAILARRQLDRVRSVKRRLRL